jgi:hypothetical protein
VQMVDSDVMSRLARAVIAFAAALAFATVPLAADWCAISCEAAHSGTSADTPECHHTGSAAPRVTSAPNPCGQDHHPIVVDATATTPAARTVVISVGLTPDIAPAIVHVAALISGPGPLLGSCTPGLPLALSSALRI